jgi:hypothetical protein
VERTAPLKRCAKSSPFEIQRSSRSQKLFTKPIWQTRSLAESEVGPRPSPHRLGSTGCLG